MSRLNTGKAARMARAEEALGSSCPIYSIAPGFNASTTIVKVSLLLTVVVSYSSAVAFCHNGLWVATPYGHYSKTTDRAVKHHCPHNVLRLEINDFVAALAKAINNA